MCGTDWSRDGSEGSLSREAGLGVAVAGADIIVGSAAGRDELTRLRIVENIASTSLDVVHADRHRLHRVRAHDAGRLACFVLVLVLVLVRSIIIGPWPGLTERHGAVTAGAQGQQLLLLLRRFQHHGVADPLVSRALLM
eukprot:2671136-Rhodomonas_salina.7